VPAAGISIEEACLFLLPFLDRPVIVLDEIVEVEAIAIARRWH
jgi:hypothetical protein